MHSSISSSERPTASDRPGVAQPVPLRPVPVLPWSRVVIVAVTLFAVLVGAWEWTWRAYGVQPSTRNTDALWAIQRRRIDNGEGNATVIAGSSREYFGLQLDVWEKLDGKRPIQLAFEGTSPMEIVEDLADDPTFTGNLIVGITPGVFFSGFALHHDAVRYARRESPSQRIGQWLSMHTIEPMFAFYDPDFALATVLKRQPWPQRPGRHWGMSVRKLSVTQPDRNTRLWEKLEDDEDYAALARRIWADEWIPSDDDPTPAEIAKTADEQIDRMVKAVAKLQARHVRVVFLRSPSDGEYLAEENRTYPRKDTWEKLLAATGAPGIHFEDYPQLQGLRLPEWSHLAYADARRYTSSVVDLVKPRFSGEAVSAVDPY